MPPKKQNEVSKKAIQKEAKQTKEDLTFGLKNKNKSKKVQEYVQSVTKQIDHKAQTLLNKDKPTQSAADVQKAQKEAERKEQQLALLRQTLKQPKLADGEDPKSVMCIHFQYGCCDKGDKCKYSHGVKVKVLTEQEIREEKLKKEVDKENQRLQELGFFSNDMGSLDKHRDMREQIMEFKARQLNNCFSKYAVEDQLS
ncbi:Zinc_finger domain-containing protein [Hexamita inflata]|uniref:Zinc finger domain-containing protein n=1 Tax=Hexamita inflata TaxID=28002 RepID=A0AA86Q6H8_9EUKA|nr:Zinc finger domain-containing protein [Hexamita inflata]